MALCECGCGQQTEIAKKTSLRDGTVKGQPNRFIHNHHTRLQPKALLSDYKEMSDGCWVWQGPAHRQTGYGRINIGGKRQWAHRASWEHHMKHPIPDGLTIHHECRNKLCVNPAHMQLVSNEDHIAITDPRGWKEQTRFARVEGRDQMSYPYAVVDPRLRHDVSRHQTVEAAARKVKSAHAEMRWTIVARGRHGNELPLSDAEREAVQRILYPAAFA